MVEVDCIWLRNRSDENFGISFCVHPPNQTLLLEDVWRKLKLKLKLYFFNLCSIFFVGGFLLRWERDLG